MDPKGLFRQAALEKLSSPERLDETMRVTAPAAWLALGALGVMLLVVIFWGIFGAIPIKVHGQGMLQSSGGIARVTASVAGRVKDVKVKQNDAVKVGDVVAQLNLPDLKVSLDNERQKLDGLKGRQPAADQEDQRVIADLRSQRRKAVDQLRAVQELVAKGLATKKQELDAQSTVTNIDNQINSREQAIEQRRKDIEEAQRNVRQFTEQLNSGGELRSPCNGRVYEISGSPGKMLQPGETVVNIERDGETIAIVFVPAADGKKVKVLDGAQISPTTVKKEEWGSINGKVQSVSSFPASTDRLKEVLGNDQLVAELNKQSPSNMEVVIRLVKDTASPSGLSWTSGAGPNQRIYSGTKCDGNVIVDKKRPISYILPIFRKGVGA